MGRVNTGGTHTFNDSGSSAPLSEEDAKKIDDAWR